MSPPTLGWFALAFGGDAWTQPFSYATCEEHRADQCLEWARDVLREECLKLLSTGGTLRARIANSVVLPITSDWEAECWSIVLHVPQAPMLEFVIGQSDPAVEARS